MLQEIKGDKCWAFSDLFIYTYIACVSVLQNPPELDAPLFGTNEEKDKFVDPGLQDLQINVF